MSGNFTVFYRAFPFFLRMHLLQSTAKDVMSMFNFREIEGTYLDYKLALEEEKPKSWLKSVSAFAPLQGGHILFGVTNNTHEAIGAKDSQADASRIAELISNRISPAPRYQLSTFPSDDGKGHE